MADTVRHRPFSRTEQVMTTLTKARQEQLDELATESQVSRSEKIRRYVEAGIDAEISGSGAPNPNPRPPGVQHTKAHAQPVHNVTTLPTVPPPADPAA